ncbi:GNAT family N-acetyltransferase [Nitrosomonas sp. JL21]|uniref:GNAT family N-acetyltransferase n=1 Tax=Nitrosomonas sp. JL21 TaxID=153949 RepID=UPI001370F27D|nr:GNAT family N-acetyltransferase [Nitrosomonas sp. JL21]MBL8496812.1 GNAT family N-acetyltransferase [Nitrosomonas sp.]MBL8498436.1 GNAT family N-acetyltransferase [Nitrosomonas sp.]
MTISIDELRIEPITYDNATDAKAIDGTFIINARLLLSTSSAGFHYEIISIPAYEERYSHAEADPRIPESYLKHSDHAGFLAYWQDRPVGFLLLSESWNRMAMIDDIQVNASHRRQGIAITLLQKAETWAHQRNLSGLRLETQDTNVAACQLYKHCGFVLGGMDQYLYAAIPESSKEIALFWYRLFNV